MLAFISVSNAGDLILVNAIQIWTEMHSSDDHPLNPTSSVKIGEGYCSSVSIIFFPSLLLLCWKVTDPARVRRVSSLDRSSVRGFRRSFWSYGSRTSFEWTLKKFTLEFHVVAEIWTWLVMVCKLNYLRKYCSVNIREFEQKSAWRKLQRRSNSSAFILFYYHVLWI